MKLRVEKYLKLALNFSIMATGLLITSDEEKARQKKLQAKKRLRLMFVILGGLIVLRLIIKDPPKYVKPTIANVPKSMGPGVLESMPEADRAKLSEAELKKYREAEINYLIAKEEHETPEWQKTPYAPQETPTENKADIEAYKQELYYYAKKQKQIEEIHHQMKLDAEIMKPLLVYFSRGGILPADKVDKAQNVVHIQVEKGLYASFRPHMVKSVKENYRGWKEPQPKGYIEVKPTRGITFISPRSMAHRITIKRELFDES